MKKKVISSIFVVITFFNSVSAQPDSIPWWKSNRLRVIQVNLPDYEAATLHADSLVEDLTKYSANTVIINAGGIMAFYPTSLFFALNCWSIGKYLLWKFLRNALAVA